MNENSQTQISNTKITALKRILSYMNKHPWQSGIVFSALALGFVISVICVGYAVILQAKTGCLTFFMK